jgi:hypothetical protein
LVSCVIIDGPEAHSELEFYSQLASLKIVIAPFSTMPKGVGKPWCAKGSTLGEDLTLMEVDCSGDDMRPVVRKSSTNVCTPTIDLRPKVEKSPHSINPHEPPVLKVATIHASTASSMKPRGKAALSQSISSSPASTETPPPPTNMPCDQCGKPFRRLEASQ